MAGLAQLGGEKYISLTTFKRDGTPVSTPVWVARDEGRLLVWTAASSWKVRRIRRDSHVQVAPSTATGKARGPAIDGRARILEDVSRVETLFRRKYCVAYPLLRRFNRLVRVLKRKKPEASVTIEIVPSD